LEVGVLPGLVIDLDAVFDFPLEEWFSVSEAFWRFIFSG